MSILEVENVSCAPWGSTLLSNINITLQAGEIHGLIGPNGAGKSTLLRYLSGEFTPATGAVKFQNKPLGEWGRLARARHIALLPQQSQLSFSFTIREVVALGRIPHKSGHQIDQGIIDDALRSTDVLGMQDRLYTQLSGGEKQRVQLARTLAQVWQSSHQTPALLLLDEPTAALDMSHQQLLMSLLRQRSANGCTIVLILHDFNLLAAIADSVSVLHRGEVFDQGTTQSVYSSAMFEQVFDSKVSLIPHPSHGYPMVMQA